MSVQQWFKSGCDYNKGVELYAQHGKNKILLKKFRRNSSTRNISKLHYELQKIADSLSVKPQISVRQVPDTVRKPKVFKVPDLPPTSFKIPPVVEESDELKKMKSKPISFYPVPLHSIYHKRIQTFLQACSLKIKLNQLPEESEEESLILQFQIFQLYEINDKCWAILRHFEDTGRIMSMKASQDYSGSTPPELFKMRENLYSRITKRKSTIKKKEIELSTATNPGIIARIENTLNEKKEELQQLQNDVDEITKLLNR